MTVVKVADCPLLEGVVGHLGHVAEFLRQSEVEEREEEKEVPNGEQWKGRGLHRLAALNFLVSLVKTNNHRVFAGLLQHGLLGLVVVSISTIYLFICLYFIYLLFIYYLFLIYVRVSFMFLYISHPLFCHIFLGCILPASLVKYHSRGGLSVRLTRVVWPSS